MNYLIITNNHEPFYTDWFDAENHFVSDVEMIVFNLYNYTHTTNGKDWQETKQDHL